MYTAILQAVEFSIIIVRAFINYRDLYAMTENKTYKKLSKPKNVSMISIF